MPTTPPAYRSFTQRLADGTEMRLHELHASDLRPLLVRAPARVRAREVAAILTHLRGSASATISLPAASIRAPATVAGFTEDDHGSYPTLRGAMLAYLARRGAGGAREAAIEALLRQLARRGLIAWHGHGTPAPVAGLGFLRQLSGLTPEQPLVNSHFFLFDPRELDAPQAALGDTTGILALAGRIHQPPLLPRSALIRCGGRWRIEQLAANDVELLLPGSHWSSTRTPGVHWHYRGDGMPIPPDYALTLVVQGRSLNAWHPRGGGRAPHGALLLGFETMPPAATLRGWRAHPRVAYRLPRYPQLEVAIGAGPLLVRAGQVLVNDALLAQERFFTLGSVDPTAPLVFPADAHLTRAARIGIGITASGTLVLVSIEGGSRLAATPHPPTTGATLIELAERLLAAGAIDAMNLDGGGSTQIFLSGGALHPSSDQRGVRGSSFDRPVPVGLQWRPATGR